MGTRKAPIPNSYWVNDHLLAGEYPGDLGDSDTRTKLGRLLEAGIRSFINLTEDGELDPYDAILREEAAARGLAVEHARMSIRDARVTTVRQMKEILGNIDRHRQANRPTYVHCWGGVGRTGTVVGCHLVECGHTGDEALAEVARLFATMPAEKVRYHPESPETDAQRAMVREWKVEARRAASPRSEG